MLKTQTSNRFSVQTYTKATVRLDAKTRQTNRLSFGHLHFHFLSSLLMSSLLATPTQDRCSFPDARRPIIRGRRTQSESRIKPELLTENKINSISLVCLGVCAHYRISALPRAIITRTFQCWDCNKQRIMFKILISEYILYIGYMHIGFGEKKQ